MSDDTMNPAHEPNYKIMELQTENENLKDKLIESLEIHIETLRKEITYLKSLIQGSVERERDVGSHLVNPPTFKPRPLIRTTSEISTILERRSLDASKLLPISAEDLKDEEIS